MKILVTGGTGSVGKRAVARLIRHGHKVKVIGRRPEMEIEEGEYQACAINDFEALREQVRGFEGIVHLAAIPNPFAGRHEEIFRVNCEGTFNVYQAAVEEGIGRIVSASSINAFGYNFGIRSFPLRYFPIDEEHPGVTTDPYSFSKQVMEETAAYFWRREGVSSVCLRLPYVYNPRPDRGGHRERGKKRFADLMALPEAEQRELMDRVRDFIERGRTDYDIWDREEYRELRGLSGGATDFWAVIHAEDSAQAIEKGLLAEYEESHPLYVNDSHNWLGIESETLARLYYPEVTERKRPLVGAESLVSIERARKLLGFEPEHSLSQQDAS